MDFLIHVCLLLIHYNLLLHLGDEIVIYGPPKTK